MTDTTGAGYSMDSKREWGVAISRLKIATYIHVVGFILTPHYTW